MMRFVLISCCTLAWVASLSGCSTSARGPYTTQAESARNPILAQELTRQAAAILDTNPDKAEQLLRDALTADLFHGPAHNNLGVIHLQRGDLYAAASEFQFAQTTMPGHPDPRLNLALTLERAGRFDDAVEEYRSALEVYPGHIQTMQARSRCLLRYRPDEVEDDPRLVADLREIALRGETPEWQRWARQQQLRLAARGD